MFLINCTLAWLSPKNKLMNFRKYKHKKLRSFAYQDKQKSYALLYIDPSFVELIHSEI